ncbi:MAG: hypothetical protein ACYTGZ_12690 [Planctomycetota bacterium]|jgi:hypothetical protein
MRQLVLILAVFVLAVPAFAQGGSESMVTAGQALDVSTCRETAEQVKKRIETWTRIKYRRPVPVLVQPRAVWERNLKLPGVAGHNARSGLAFYNIINNSITIVPWVIGRYRGTKNPPKRFKDEWTSKLESILIHELMHALHHQNFYVVLGGARMASMRTGGLSSEEKDVSTVEFLTAEGTAELVSVRTATPRARTNLTRRPNLELDRAQRYWDKYQPDNKKPFRIILSNSGYQDGLDLLNRLDRKAGPRAIRALLYRQPPRELFFQPDLLAKLKLDDPPDPDSVFEFLSPDGVKFGEVHLAVNPGADRNFTQAMPGARRSRAAGCLIGYTAGHGDEDDKHGRVNYSFFVADPDKPGTWSTEQADAIKALEPAGTKIKKIELPMAKGVKADVIDVKRTDGSRWVRAEVEGLVVLARETKPTSNLADRVIRALRVLYIRRPTKNLYGQLLPEAAKTINKSEND